MTVHVRYRQGDGDIVFELEGEIDLSNVDTVEEEIRRGLDEESRILVDLSRTDYIDSAGLRMLFALARTVSGRMSVVVPERSPIRRVVSMVGLSKVAPLLTELPGGNA